MSDDKYKAAYERQKIARARAEQLLEDKSRELYEANQSLRLAFEKLKDQKSQIYNQEKLAAVGLLSAGVAHEINNPAGYVLSNLSTLKNYILQWAQYQQKMTTVCEEALSADQFQAIEKEKKKLDIDYIMDDTPDLITESIEGLKRIEGIVKNLKDFSRPDSAEKEEFSLNDSIKNTLELVKSEATRKAEIITNFSDIPFIFGTPGSISQVVLNLIINACHAIEDFGEIRITTRLDGDYVVADISDNGCGIEEKDLQAIFNPFFSTKETGTGLGLSVSHGIISQHGGRMSVQSEKGVGTTFSLWLPAQKHAH